jgi:hypothetical protein
LLPLQGQQVSFFRMHPALCAAAPQIFRRRLGLAPKVDAWLVAAFHCRASQLASEQRVYRFERDVPCISIPYEPTALFSILCCSGSGAPTEAVRDDWRDLCGGLQRLEEVETSFPLMVRNGRKLVRFRGPLAQREQNSDEVHAGRRVLLRCCAPPGVGYFALMPRHAFELRHQLGETATAALMRLCYFHRGSKPKGQTLRHRWTLPVQRATLEASGLVDYKPGRRAETWARLLAAFDELQRAGVLQFKTSPTAVQLELSKDWFHREGE